MNRLKTEDRISSSCISTYIKKMVQVSILILIRECKLFIFNCAMTDIQEKYKEVSTLVSLNPVY